MLGLWSGLVIGLQTEFFTSHEFSQTRELARCCLFDAATNIIKGLALGYLSNILHIIVLAITLLCSFHWAGMYGVALSALGMLGCLPVYLTIDCFGAVAANSFSMAQMARLHKDVQDITSKIDAAGVTTACVGKAYTNGQALLTAIALFGSYAARVSTNSTDALDINILSPYTFSGLLMGAMIPYGFSALVMTAINSTAEEIINDVKEQAPKIKAGSVPDHKQIILRTTVTSFSYLIAPACLVILSPILWGVLLGFRFVSGLIAGCITAGIQIGISAQNSGGAWGNTSRYVQLGNLVRPDEFMKPEQTDSKVVRGDIEYKAA